MAPTADLLPPWLCEGDTSPSGVPVASLAEALKRVYNMDMVAMVRSLSLSLFPKLTSSLSFPPLIQDVIPFVPSYSWHIRTVKERGGWTEPHNKGDKKLLSLLVQGALSSHSSFSPSFSFLSPVADSSRAIYTVLAEQDPSIKGFLLLGSTSRLVLIDKDAKTGEYSPSVSNLNDKPAATAFHPILVYNAVNSPQETFNMLYLARSTLRLVQGGKLKDFWPVLREVYERRSGGGFLMEANDIETVRFLSFPLFSSKLMPVHPQVLGFKLSAAKCSNIPASIASAAKINRDSPAYEGAFSSLPPLFSWRLTLLLLSSQHEAHLRRRLQGDPSSLAQRAWQRSSRREVRYQHSHRGRFPCVLFPLPFLPLYERVDSCLRARLTRSRRQVRPRRLEGDLRSES